jgi:hypothetical protein
MKPGVKQNGASSGAAAAAASGDESDFLARRLPDLLLFGLKLATLTNEPLPDEQVSL